MMDNGLCVICNLENTAAPGDMSKYVLRPVQDGDNTAEWQFESRRIGYGRQYEAKGVSERVDMLIRIWQAPARIGQYAVLSEYEGQENPDGDQYRIDNVQQLTDDDGLKVTDLTLYRLDELYEVSTE